jgi:NCAIR mutase (PurE)-related protein
MDRDRLRALLDQLAAGQTTVADAMQALRVWPTENLDFARVDLHRGLRSGFPEVIFGQGKTTPQILTIAERIASAGGPLLATRLSAEAGQALADRFADGHHDPDARTFHLVKEPIPDRGRGTILIISAGTSDLPVAGEAALTAELLGNRVERLTDVGVAGIHRLFEHQAALQAAEVLVVVAGMEGALPSVVGGLVDRPVVAVPTSVGYGASFGGLAALLGMLNSCAPGVTVVNIDNGFGAGFAAGLMNRRQDPS